MIENGVGEAKIDWTKIDIKWYLQWTPRTVSTLMWTPQDEHLKYLYRKVSEI